MLEIEIKIMMVKEADSDTRLSPTVANGNHKHNLNKELEVNGQRTSKIKQINEYIRQYFRGSFTNAGVIIQASLPN